MRVLKFIGKGILALFAVIAIALLGLFLTDTTYYSRIFGIPFIDNVADVDWYKPLEVVKGVPAPAITRAPDNLKTIRQEGWDKALDYAKKMDSYALVVWQHGAIQYEYYKPGFAPEHRTDPASMHKSVLALVVGMAIDDGSIKSVDEPAATYLPEWANDDRKKITIRHLLNMASGLAREPFSPSPMSQGMKLNLGTEITQLSLSMKAAEEPGTVFAYYNVNPQVLGIIIERATKKRYAEYLSEKLWSKLGTQDARVFLDHEGGMARTFCCLQANAEDWVRVGLLHLNKGKVDGKQVVPEEWMKQVTTPSPLNPNYGFQTWLGTTYEEKRSYGKAVPTFVPHSEPFAAEGIIYFDGAGGQRVYVIPSLDMVIVRTGAGGIDFKTGAFKWDDAIIPNALIRGSIPKEELATQNIFWKRFFFPPKDPMEPDYGWYDPGVVIKGADAATAPAFPPAVKPGQETISAEALKAAAAYAEEHRGNGLIVVQDGVVQLEKYWNGYTRDKQFSGHSMTKTITALAVGKAIEEGFITSTDDPIGKYITEWANDARGKIPLKAVLHMASGLKPSDRGVPGVKLSPYNQTIQQSWGPDIVGTTLGFQIREEPEKRFEHENANPTLLGIIVQRATKMPYAEYLSTRIWQPLGASDAILPLDHADGMAHTDCCLVSRPSDWVRVGEMLRNGGKVGDKQIIPAAWIAEMTQASPANPNYGYQIWLGSPYTKDRPYSQGGVSTNSHSEPYVADDVIFLDGFGHKRVYVVPSRKLVVIRLGLVDPTYDDAMLPNLIMRGQKGL